MADLVNIFFLDYIIAAISSSRYEHEIGHDNLKELEIPEELVVKFDTFDKEVVDQV